MKVSELQQKLNLTLLTDMADREISGCYIGDLLSWVMGRAQQDNIWITIMNNINIVAVASLTDCACIILSEGVGLTDDVIKKANSQDVVILGSELTTFELAEKISTLL